MRGLLSRLLGIHREPIKIHGGRVVVSSNVLNDPRPIEISGDEVLIFGNKTPVDKPPWYQRPFGYVGLTAVAGIIVLAIWSFLGTSETVQPPGP